MNLRERLRRWWKPAEYADRPLSEEEREQLQDRPSYAGRRAKIGQISRHRFSPSWADDPDDLGAEGKKAR